MSLVIRTIRELFVITASILEKHNDGLLKAYEEGLGELADISLVLHKIDESWSLQPKTRGKKYRAWLREHSRLISAKCFLKGERRTKLRIVRASLKVKAKRRGNPLNLYTKDKEGRKLPVCTGQYILFEIIDRGDQMQSVGRICIMPKKKGGCYQVEVFYSPTEGGLESELIDVLPEQVLEVYSDDPATYLPIYEEIEAQYAAELEAYWTAKMTEISNLTDDGLCERMGKLVMKGEVGEGDTELNLLNEEYERRKQE